MLAIKCSYIVVRIRRKSRTIASLMDVQNRSHVPRTSRYTSDLTHSRSLIAATTPAAWRPTATRAIDLSIVEHTRITSPMSARCWAVQNATPIHRHYANIWRHLITIALSKWKLMLIVRKSWQTKSWGLRMNTFGSISRRVLSTAWKLSNSISR